MINPPGFKPIPDEILSKFHFMGNIPGLASWQLTPIMMSHGWINLHPFNCFSNGFIYSFSLGKRPSISLLVKREAAGVGFYLDTPIKSGQEKSLMNILTRILSLDFPLQEFQSLCKHQEEHSFLSLARRGWGRMLRCATPWEDAVKTLCTTNASWPHTVKMCNELVEKGGAATRSGHLTFPGPSNLLTTFPVNTGDNPLGYRLQYAHALAENALGIDSWLLKTGALPQEAKLLSRISVIQRARLTPLEEKSALKIDPCRSEVLSSCKAGQGLILKRCESRGGKIGR